METTRERTWERKAFVLATCAVILAVAVSLFLRSFIESSPAEGAVPPRPPPRDTGNCEYCKDFDPTIRRNLTQLSEADWKRVEDGWPLIARIEPELRPAVSWDDYARATAHWNTLPESPLFILQARGPLLRPSVAREFRRRVEQRPGDFFRSPPDASLNGWYLWWYGTRELYDRPAAHAKMRELLRWDALPFPQSWHLDKYNWCEIRPRCWRLPPRYLSSRFPRQVLRRLRKKARVRHRRAHRFVRQRAGHDRASSARAKAMAHSTARQLPMGVLVTCLRSRPFGRVRIRRRAVAARDRSPTGGERRVKLHAAYGCVCPVLHRSTARARALCSGYVSRSRGKEPRAGSHRKLRAASGEPLALMTRLLMTGKYFSVFTNPKTTRVLCCTSC